MSILVTKNSRVVVQGITGGAGSFHARQCLEYGTQIVSGVTPGRGGEKFDGKVPVFNTVAEAVAETRADVSLIFVPPPGAADAILEAADAGVGLVICITEGIPILDMVRVRRWLEGTNVDAGRKMLDQSGLAIQVASTMADGAKKIVAAIGARG